MMNATASNQIRIQRDTSTNKSLPWRKFEIALRGDGTCPTPTVSAKEASCNVEPNYIDRSIQSFFDNKEFKPEKNKKTSQENNIFTSLKGKKDQILINSISDPKQIKNTSLKNTIKYSGTLFSFADKNTIQPQYSLHISKSGVISLIFHPKENVFYSKKLKEIGWVDFSNGLTMDKVYIRNGNKKISVQDAMIQAGFMNKCWYNIGYGDWCFKRDMPDAPIKK